MERPRDNVDPTPEEEAEFDEFEERQEAGTLDEMRSAFSQLAGKLAKKKKNGKKAIKNPKGLAYTIGVAKLGKAKMTALAKAGKAKAAKK